MLSTRLALAILLMTIPLVAGCGNGLAKVSGSVTMDGQSVGGTNRYGTVSFYKEGGGGVPAIGIIDPTGRYSLKTGAQEGIVPGAYRVEIAIKKVTPPASPGGMPQATLISPAKYTSVAQSGLREEVKPGSNAIDFALVSKGP
jgi:hypothetical protein